MSLLLAAACSVDPVICNAPPEIGALFASPPDPAARDTVALTVVASDADGDSLAYRWYASAGTFAGGGETAQPHWIAPAAAQRCTLFVDVADDLHTVRGSLSLDISPPAPTIPVYGYTLIDSFPHDPRAFTQGLVYHAGRLYEGTGHYNGGSTLREVDLETGEVLRRHTLAGRFFGEGITILHDRIYQLTWREGRLFVYDRETFAPLDTLSYSRQGWGLAHDGELLIMSDGSDRLAFRDPETFAIEREIRVHADGEPVYELNELEFIEGEVYANVYETQRIARIDPQTGAVTAWIDLTGLKELGDYESPKGVLNGIACDTASDRLFVTGKYWSLLFEIVLVPPERGVPYQR